MIYRGRTLFISRSARAKNHLWVVLNDPSGPDLQVVIVSLTTKRAHSDPTVTLQPADHPFVIRPTAVHYSDARLVHASQLQSLIESGTTSPHTDCDGDLVERIANGLLASDRTPQWIAQWYGLHVLMAE